MDPHRLPLQLRLGEKGITLDVGAKEGNLPGRVREMVGQVTKLVQLFERRSQKRMVRSWEPETNMAPPQVYSDRMGPEWPERLRNVCVVAQSVT